MVQRRTLLRRAASAVTGPGIRTSFNAGPWPGCKDGGGGGKGRVEDNDEEAEDESGARSGPSRRGALGCERE